MVNGSHDLYQCLLLLIPLAFSTMEYHRKMVNTKSIFSCRREGLK